METIGQTIRLEQKVTLIVKKWLTNEVSSPGQVNEALLKSAAMHSKYRPRIRATPLCNYSPGMSHSSIPRAEDEKELLMVKSYDLMELDKRHRETTHNRNS